jgi:hypothetical protein
MFKLLVTTLMLVQHAHAQSGTVTANSCTCAIPAVDGVCPAETTISASKNSNAKILWQDAYGNRRPETKNKCCQVASSVDASAGNEECSDRGFDCNSYTEGSFTTKNPFSCTKEEPSGSFLCVCNTKKEFDEGASGATQKLLIGAVVGAFCAIFVFVYGWHWYFCGSNYDGCCEKTNKGNGCFFSCCNFRKHCFGHGTFVKTCLYYILFCPCRCLYCGCYGREKLLVKDKSVCCQCKPAPDKFDGAAGAPDTVAAVGAPEALDMVA